MSAPDDDRPADEDGDRRGFPRRRTRLRPAKLVGADDSFVADCRIENRSESGALLVFFGEVPEREDAVLFDETLGTSVPVILVWRFAQRVGVRFCGSAHRLGRLRRERLGGRYYAVND